MLSPATALLTLIVVGAGVTAALRARLERMSPARLARAYLVATTALMGVRVAAYVAANIFGVAAARPASTGPYDLTNLLVGGLFGFAASGAKDDWHTDFLREPDLLLALRVATGVAFILAGLGNVFFIERTGIDFFLKIGYTHTFHLFIMTAEILGGAALLLPWRWLTLAAIAGLTIDMSGALLSHVRAGDSPDVASAAIVMVLRLCPLALLAARGRWVPVAAGAVACAAIAIVGGTLMLRA
jgi:uncharacterized membrane protein YphA (DoxX/SURF4 family)